MYSPKISEALIPTLYRLGKVRRIPMTRLVDSLIRKALQSEELPLESKEWMGVGNEESAKAA
jgi:hypothetical protein